MNKCSFCNGSGCNKNDAELIRTLDNIGVANRVFKENAKYMLSIEAENKRLRSIIEGMVKLLKDARCPVCDGSGFVVMETGGCDMDGENDTRECMKVECEWCKEKEKAREGV